MMAVHDVKILKIKQLASILFRNNLYQLQCNLLILLTA
ncbi:hypothetical protein B398_07535 [Xylella fastidiosa 32]|nr:hypothetical protein B398_07535 [Xylella fastidiosa 32]